MSGLVAYLWLVSGSFCGLFGGHSICHAWPRGSRGCCCLILNNMLGGSCVIIC